MLDLQEKMARCFDCEETWFKNEFLWELWYPELHDYIKKGKCFFKPEGLTIFEKIIPPEIFYPCLHQGLKEQKLKRCHKQIQFSNEEYIMDRRILMMHNRYDYKRIINGASQGVQMLKDLRSLSQKYGLGRTFEYDWRFYDFEIFMDFWAEFIYPLTYAFTAVIIVVLVITSDIIATMLVALCVILTDLFLTGLIHYWGLTLNPIVILQIVLGIGCSVDFSAHIAYAYLVEDVSHLLSEKASKS